jgi:hypothetical protein
MNGEVSPRSIVQQQTAHETNRPIRKVPRLHNEITGSGLHDLDGYHKPFHQSYRFAYGFLDVVLRQIDNHAAKADSNAVHRKVHLIAQPAGNSWVIRSVRSFSPLLW